MSERTIYGLTDVIQATDESIPFALEMEGQYTKAYRIRYASCYLRLMKKYLEDAAEFDMEAAQLLKLLETDPEGALFLLEEMGSD